MNRQLGFGLWEGILASLIIALVILGGYYFVSRNDPKESTNNQTEDTVETRFPPPIEEVHIDEVNGYSLIFTDRRIPLLKHVSPTSFRLRNTIGAVLIYDADAKQFKLTEPASEPKILESYARALETDIYLWESSNDGIVTRTYLIVLPNGKILQATFTYNVGEPSEGEQVLTDEAFEAQKQADTKTMETFSYLY